MFRRTLVAQSMLEERGGQKGVENLLVKRGAGSSSNRNTINRAMRRALRTCPARPEVTEALPKQRVARNAGASVFEIFRRGYSEKTPDRKGGAMVQAQHVRRDAGGGP